MKKPAPHIVLELSGATLITYAGWTESQTLGLILAGISCIYFSLGTR